MMTPEALNESITEAERFIKAAKAARARLLLDKYANFGCKQTGAAKRASLDLTRSLARLRNPSYRGENGK